jgi:hypothetical protein
LPLKSCRDLREFKTRKSVEVGREGEGSEQKWVRGSRQAQLKGRTWRLTLPISFLNITSTLPPVLNPILSFKMALTSAYLPR